MQYWNKDILDDTQGLDILGIRALDQGIEANLVNGVTTVSARGRYFSVLPWAINQYYQMTIQAGKPFVQEEFSTFLTRVEFLINAASQADPSGKPGGAILGSDVFGEQMKALKSGQPVPLPSSKGSRILNIYYNPCKGIGLLDDGSANDKLPYQLTERGKTLWAARQTKLENSPILKLLYDGGNVDPDIAIAAVPEFSLGSLSSDSEEAKLLRTAFRTPWQATKAYAGTVEQRYALFLQTQDWIASWSSDGQLSANRVLARNLQACSQGERSDQASIAWAEYEWRRRQHFALELLLSSICGMLRLIGDASPIEIVQAAEADSRSNGALAELWPDCGRAWAGSVKQAVLSVPEKLMLGTPLPSHPFNQLRDSQKMLASFALITALESQTRTFRDVDISKPTKSISDLALKLILSAGDQPFPEFLKSFAEDCAIVPHLQVTLRKMAPHRPDSHFHLPPEILLNADFMMSAIPVVSSRHQPSLDIPHNGDSASV